MIRTKNINITIVVEYETVEEIEKQYLLAILKLTEQIQSKPEVLRQPKDSNLRVRMIHENT